MIKNKKIFSNSVISLILNILTIVYVALLLGFWYEGNDEMAMARIAYNGCNYVVHQNTILGLFYKTLFQLYNGVNWESVFFCVVTFISGYVIVKSLLDIVKNKQIGIFMCVCFSAFFMVDMYNQMQYTKTATFVTITGITYLYNIALQNELQDKCKCLVGILLIILGSMIRFKSVCFSIVYAALVVLLYMKDYFYSDKKWEYIKKHRALIMVFFCTFVLCLTIKVIDATITYNNFGEYMKVDYYRTTVLDQRKYDYNDVCTDMKTIGVSENDYHMINNWMFSDPEFFTADKFKQIEKIAVKKQQPIQLWYELQNATTYPICIICVIMICSLILFGYRKKKHFTYWLFSFLGTVLLYAILTYVSKRVVYRVEFCVWMVIFIFCTIVASEDIKVSRKKTIADSLDNFVALRRKSIHI